MISNLAQILQIPLAQIRPNPNNPRGPVNPADAQAMADSLREIGQKTPLKVRTLTEEEKVQFAPFEYLLIGGHVRLEGAKLADMETLQALDMPPRTPEEEEMDAL